MKKTGKMWWMSARIVSVIVITTESGFHGTG